MKATFVEFDREHHRIGFSLPSSKCGQDLQKKYVTLVIIGVVVGLVLLILIGFAAFFVYKRWKSRKKPIEYVPLEEVPSKSKTDPLVIEPESVESSPKEELVS